MSYQRKFQLLILFTLANILCQHTCSLLKLILFPSPTIAVETFPFISGPHFATAITDIKVLVKTNLSMLDATNLAYNLDMEKCH